ncbi:CW-type zinc finger protein 4 [Seminavis robusta]|uniref:CW-type zinc finger protein 4 n=1 Tax=Seminavis robusta TaxID=568900 RepID=A0A9N8DGX9_9STRA|nr:CW-type zinc finger protein 4 [Seminavis robusta]|eukprot:Sro137_g064410.1 CW-type zinc finger protein 4 (499) ;mRNA; f:65609-67216
MSEKGMVSQEAALSPRTSPSHHQDAAAMAPEGVVAPPEPRASKKTKRKKPSKRKAAAAAASGDGAPVPSSMSEDPAAEPSTTRKTKKVKKKHKEKHPEKESKASSSSAPPTSEPPPPPAAADNSRKKPRKKAAVAKVQQPSSDSLSEAQKAVNEQMRRVLEEDQYTANGSIVDTDTDNEESIAYRGETVRMDRSALMGAMRKHLWMERLNSGAGNVVTPKPGGGAAGASGGAGDDDEDDNDNRRGGRKKKKKGKRKEAAAIGGGGVGGADDLSRMSSVDEAPLETSRTADAIVNPNMGVTAADDTTDEFDDRDGGSIFGQTSGSSNATWVECDKCKKWRRLRGVVDEKKLPSRWYCSMNKNDPDRARCSAPEEEYETPNTPESAADARTRKHLRVWVRRLQCHEAYESRQPTLTRGRKRANATSKEPHEWVRCCNQSCGKWRAILKIMDAKSSVIDRTRDGEWYCVMNTWDEKMASCAAPQENLPAIGCPGWVYQDEN